jgi:hypothetical protein
MITLEKRMQILSEELAGLLHDVELKARRAERDQLLKELAPFVYCECGCSPSIPVEALKAFIARKRHDAIWNDWEVSEQRAREEVGASEPPCGYNPDDE